MDKQKLGELRNLRKLAMPGPVGAVTSAGYYGTQGAQVGPVIRFMGSKRAENQRFVVAAFNHWDALLDEIIRLQGQRAVLVRLLERAAEVCRTVRADEVDRDDGAMLDLLDQLIQPAIAAINAVLAEQMEVA